MIVMLSAEMNSSGVWDYEKDIDLSLDQVPLPESLISEIVKWRNAYEKYNALPDLSIMEVKKRVDELDLLGIDIIRRALNHWGGTSVSKFYYYSVARDKLLYVLYEDGRERWMLPSTAADL